jgi:hypothetical protein
MANKTRTPKYPSEMLHTRLKLERDKKTGGLIGFVTKRENSSKIIGVRRNAPGDKKTCIPSTHLRNALAENVLYSVGIVKAMNGAADYIIASAEPYTFTASIASSYVPKAVYKVEIKFGHKNIQFNPMDGKKDSMRTMEGVYRLLKDRQDIANIQEILVEFREAATNLIKLYTNDGFHYSESDSKG